jgi:hypothetical protein
MAETAPMVVHCDNGCGRTLTPPVPKEAAEGWQRLSLSVISPSGTKRLYVAHVCPSCPDTAVRARLEAIR